MQKNVCKKYSAEAHLCIAPSYLIHYYLHIIVVLLLLIPKIFHFFRVLYLLYLLFSLLVSSEVINISNCVKKCFLTGNDSSGGKKRNYLGIKTNFLISMHWEETEK